MAEIELASTMALCPVHPRRRDKLLRSSKRGMPWVPNEKRKDITGTDDVHRPTLMSLEGLGNFSFEPPVG